MIYAEAHAMAAALLMGATLIVKRKFSASSFFSDCAKFNATVVQVTALPSHICAHLRTWERRHPHAYTRVRFGRSFGFEHSRNRSHWRRSPHGVKASLAVRRGGAPLRGQVSCIVQHRTVPHASYIE